ncbi:MAG: hypothetical protein WDM89_14920 [Rhizomicrobium sp.]
MSDKLERQKKDFEYRLCTLSAQQLGASQGAEDDQTTLPCPGGSGASATYNAPQPPPAQQAIFRIGHSAPRASARRVGHASAQYENGECSVIRRIPCGCVTR